MKKTAFALLAAALLTPQVAAAQPVAAAPPKAPAAAGPRIIMLRWFVADLQRATKFYQTVFGMNVVQHMGDKVNIMMFPGGSMPGLILIQSASEKEMNGSFVIQVADVKATLAKAEAAGGKLMNTRFAQKIDGVPASSSHFIDPDGNIVEVMQMGAPPK